MLAVRFTRNREPHYNGKSLSEWLAVDSDERYARAKREPANSQREQAIRQIGTNALPWLLLWVKNRPPKFQCPEFIPIVPSLLNESIDSADRKARRALHATYAFAILREQARPAIPELAALLNDRRAALHAAHALAFIGPDAAPALIKYLADTSAPNPQEAIWGIAASRALVRDPAVIISCRFV